MKQPDAFQTIRVVGGLFTTELLQNLAANKVDEGLRPEDYHLSGIKLGEETSRRWYALQAAWGRYRETREKLEASDLGTGVARDRWLLPLFSELGYGRLQLAKGLDIEGKSYPISHMWGSCPIHLIGHGIKLDERTQSAAGAARQSPHSLVQEYLNRSPNSLWGFVSNGLVLRLLRDNASLTRQAYVEFDLEAMMEQEAYSDFVLLWLLCHESRVTGERPDLCWLEKWSQKAQQEGSRALQKLRDGVTEAIRKLGEGFLTHPRNTILHEKLSSGELKPQDYYHQLLRTIYRILFLLVAEARGLLLVPGASEEVKERYQHWYSITRLRNLSEKRRGSKHPDLWQGLRILFRLLGSKSGCHDLGIPALGSYLWSEQAVPDISSAELSNRYLLDALRELSRVKVDNRTTRIDFRNLGAEELGSIYEALLELHPEFTDGFSGFRLDVASGSARKTTGSYYTPTSLINELLDSALMPVMERAEKEGRKQSGNAGAEKALLDLKVCDPACGSGHFLIAAAHRIAKRLAAIRTGEEEPTPEPYRKALRDVISHCIYGVDLNPMAVELCKVSLWLEALEPGKPLSFLDHHLRIGNSLIGATPELIAKGIPDGAFKAVTGDDKTACSKYAKLNKKERTTEQRSFFGAGAEFKVIAELESPTDYELSEDDIDEVNRREARFHSYLRSPAYLRQLLVADAWCAAFFWQKTEHGLPPITTQTLRQIEQNPLSLPEEMVKERERLYRIYAFFHWFLEFPEVFGGSDPDRRGFDVVLGNPPWERIKLQEKEWFAARVPEIANARNKSEREKLIKALKTTYPKLHAEFEQALREAEASSQFVRESGRFPLCGQGDVNTYTLFTELNRNLISERGRAGCIVPSGIATDDTTKEFFQSLVNSHTLSSLWEFENEGFFLDAGQGHMNRFCLLCITGTGYKQKADFAFQLKAIIELQDMERHFCLSESDFELLNPNTRTCPIFRSKKDAELTKAIYRRVPVLIKEARDGRPEENPWGISFMRMFDMSNDSHLFRTRDQLEAEGWKLNGNIFECGDSRFLPLFEAKMTHLLDHRFGDFELVAKGKRAHVLPPVSLCTKQNPSFEVQPYYWVEEAEVASILSRTGWDRKWLFGWRDVTDARASARTVITAAIPLAAVGDKYLLCFPKDPKLAMGILAVMSSSVFDYAARQKVGGLSLKFFTMKQLPVPSPTDLQKEALWASHLVVADWIAPRILELTYTSWSMKPFAVDAEYEGAPFLWDEERRFAIRCELDAALFHLYGCSHEDTEYIMNTFPIVRDRDIKQYTTYRTKDTTLSIFEAMQHAIDTGEPYKTILDPPPADPQAAHYA